MEYISSVNKNVPAKEFSHDYNCNGLMKCIENVPAGVDLVEFNKFSELEDYNLQNMYIANNIKEVHKKQSYVQANNAVRMC